AGDITLPGGVLNIGGGTSLTAAGDITLNNNANTFASTVFISDGGGNVSLAAAGNLGLSTSVAPAILTAVAGGALGESGPVSVSGAASFTGGTITLTDLGNLFQGLDSLSSSGALALPDA